MEKCGWIVYDDMSMRQAQAGVPIGKEMKKVLVFAFGMVLKGLWNEIHDF